MLRYNDRTRVTQLDDDVEDKSRSFWRDEAKFSWLAAEERWLSYVKIAVALSTVIGSSVAVGRAILAFGDDPWLIGGIIASLSYPAYLIVELFFKGENAGNSLIAKNQALENAAKDKLKSSQTRRELTRLRKRINDCVASHGDPPLVDKTAQGEAMRVFTEELTAKLARVVGDANGRISRIDGTVVVDFSAAECSGWYELKSEIRTLLDWIDSETSVQKLQ